MKLATDTAGRVIEPLPENLFREPIDRLYADHFRLRVICDLLDRLAGEEITNSSAQTAHAIVDYLEHDLPLHIADEEDLLRVLRPRCDPLDNVDAAIARLHDEHYNEMQIREALLPLLRQVVGGAALEQPTVTCRRFAIVTIVAEDIRRHLAREEGLILPLAKRRLLPADMAALGRRMAARRGIAYPEG